MKLQYYNTNTYYLILSTTEVGQFMIFVYQSVKVQNRIGKEIVSKNDANTCKAQI